MATITTGYSFVANESNVTHTKLNNAVNLATLSSIVAADVAADAITAAKLNADTAGSGIEQDANGALAVVGNGFTTTALTNANQTLTRSSSKRIQKYTGTLTGAVVINISRTNAVAGDEFLIRIGGVVTTAVNTLTIQENGEGSLLAFSAAKTVTGTIICGFNGTSWEIILQNVTEV